MYLHKKRHLQRIPFHSVLSDYDTKTDNEKEILLEIGSEERRNSLNKLDMITANTVSQVSTVHPQQRNLTNVLGKKNE